LKLVEKSPSHIYYLLSSMMGASAQANMVTTLWSIDRVQSMFTLTPAYASMREVRREVRRKMLFLLPLEYGCPLSLFAFR